MNAVLPKVHQLLLTPGGIKGFLELGFLYEAEKAGMLTDLKAVWGISVGALLGVPLLLGYKPEEIAMDLLPLQVTDLLLSSSLLQRSQFYVLSTDALRNKLQDWMEQKAHKRRLTLEEFRQHTKRNLYISTTTKKHIEGGLIYNADAHPNVYVDDAVIRSLAIPIAIEPQQEDGLEFFDGMIANGFPLPEIIKSCGPEDNILAVIINAIPASETGVFGRLKMFVTLAFDAHRYARCEHAKDLQNFLQRTGRLDLAYITSHIGTFHATKEERLDMFKEGQKAFAQYFKSS